MKIELHVGFVTTCSGRWPRQLPEQRAREYGDWLERELPALQIVHASVIAGSQETVEQITKEFREKQVDVLVMLYGAFTGDDIPVWFSEMLHVPILLWAPYEISFEKEERLYSNALCSMTMNAAALRKIGAEYDTVYGSKEDVRVSEKVKTILMAYHVVKSLRHTCLGLLGYRPTAFYNCTFDESLIRRTFGVRMEETDLKVIFDRMAVIPDSEWQADMDKMSSVYDTSLLPEGYLENHSRLYLALKDVMRDQHYDFATLKCWPEMGNLHTTPCAVLGRLADDGVLIGCEGDVDAELAQLTEYYLTGKPGFITDLINVDEKKNLITFWHCGNAAPSLANSDYELQLRNHPLAGQGTAFYGALKPGPVTIARFCNIDGVYKLFLMKGDAVPMDRYTRGIMATVRVGRPVREILDQIITEGVAHHYSIVWEDVAEKMKMICRLLHISVIEA